MGGLEQGSDDAEEGGLTGAIGALVAEELWQVLATESGVALMGVQP
jgi:hypothetical protein